MLKPFRIWKEPEVSVNFQLRPNPLPSSPLASGILVETIANFELSFLVCGAESQTLVINLYYAIFAVGMRPVYAVDAMAVIYMILIMSLLLIILRFVPPTQMVFRLDKR